MSEGHRAVRVALLGLLIHLIVCANQLRVFGGDASSFLHFGRARSALGLSAEDQQKEMTRARFLTHARTVLGTVLTPSEQGHDARYFWILARDPLLRHVEDVLAYTDRPAYRAQRVGYPLLVYPWALFGERALLLGMLVTNLVVVFLGGYACARLAQALAIPVRAGLAFALNPGVILAVLFDLSDALALLFLVVAVLALVRRRIGWAAAAGACAVLAKEPSLLALVGVAALSPTWIASRSRAGENDELPFRESAFVVAIPALVGGAWAVYVRARLGWSSAPIVEFGAPFAGYVDAWGDYWAPDGAIVDGLGTTLVVVAAVTIGLRWMKRRTLLLRAAVPYAFMVPFLSSSVLELLVNSFRALAPALTFLVLDIYAEEMRTSPTSREALPQPM
jgi:hypothetical protein